MQLGLLLVEGLGISFNTWHCSSPIRLCLQCPLLTQLASRKGQDMYRLSTASTPGHHLFRLHDRLHPWPRLEEWVGDVGTGWLWMYPQILAPASMASPKSDATLWRWSVMIEWRWRSWGNYLGYTRYTNLTQTHTASLTVPSVFYHL